MKRLPSIAKALTWDALKLYWELLVTMVPVLILVKAGVELGLLEGLVYLLDPVIQ